MAHPEQILPGNTHHEQAVVVVLLRAPPGRPRAIAAFSCPQTPTRRFRQSSGPPPDTPLGLRRCGVAARVFGKLGCRLGRQGETSRGGHWLSLCARYDRTRDCLLRWSCGATELEVREMDFRQCSMGYEVGEGRFVGTVL